jgi:hypothetical protein
MTMNFDEIPYFICLIASLAWLVWLSLRPFRVNLNRLLFLIFGMSLFGFLVHAIYSPMTDAYVSYIAANQEMTRMTGAWTAPAYGEVYLSMLLYFVASLAIYFPSMLWLQRVLASCPQRNAA